MSFFPPVTFVVDVVAGQAIAGFEAINAELTRVQANSIKAAGGLEAVGKSAMFAKMAFIGVGLAAAAFGAYATKASMENEVAANKLEQTLANMGDTSKETYDQINNLANSMTNLGFSDNIVMDSMSKLITATGSVSDATHLNAVAMDMARFKHISLSDASGALAKATQGNARAFKEYGITMDTSLPKQEAINKALTQLQDKLGGQSQAYAETLAGKIEILHARFELMAENIGNAVIPIISKFVDVIYLVGKVIAAVFGPMVRFINDHKTAFATLTIVVVTFYTTLKVAMGIQMAYRAVMQAYAFWTYSSAAATGIFTTAVNMLSTAFSKNPIGFIIAGLMALAAAFVYAWNHSETFRKIIVEGMKGAVMGVGYLIKAFGWLVETFVKIETGPLRLLLKGLAALGFGPAKDALKELNKGIENIGGFFDKAGNNVQDFADKLDGLKDKKIPLPKFGGSGASNTSREDPFNLNNYTGADEGGGGSKLDKLHETYKKTYDKIIKVVEDANQKIAKATEDRIERDLAAQKNYEDEVFKINRSYSEDMYKLQRDYEETKYKLNRDYSEKIESANKTYRETTLKAQADYEQRNLDISKSFADKKRAVIQKSISLLTNAFAGATSVDIGSMFAQSFSKDNKLADTLLNQVKGGVTSAVSWWGTSAKSGIEGLISDLQNKLSGAKELTDNAAKLAAQGYSQTFIQQIVSQGAEVGNQMATAILSASPEAQAQLQSLYGEIQNISENGLTDLATQMNSGATLATKALTDEFAALENDLQEALKANSESLTVALADALKVLNESKLAASKDLAKGLEDAKKNFDDAVYDLNVKLNDALFDANKTLQDALEASQKQFLKSVTDITNAMTAKLKALQKTILETLALIAALGGATGGGGGSVTAKKTYSPENNVVTNFNAGSFAMGEAASLKEYDALMAKQNGITVNNYNNIVGTDMNQFVTVTTGAVKLGAPLTISGAYDR